MKKYRKKIKQKMNYEKLNYLVPFVAIIFVYTTPHGPWVNAIYM